MAGRDARSPNVNMSRKIVTIKRDPSNVGGGFLATSGRQNVAVNVDSIILAK